MKDSINRKFKAEIIAICASYEKITAKVEIFPIREEVKWLELRFGERGHLYADWNRQWIYTEGDAFFIDMANRYFLSMEDEHGKTWPLIQDTGSLKLELYGPVNPSIFTLMGWDPAACYNATNSNCGRIQ